MLDSMLRVDVVAQQARAAFSSGRSCLAGKRPDLRFQEEMDCEKVEQARELMSKYNVRPSLGGPIVSTSFGVLGLLSNVLPRAAASAVEAGFEDAFVETFNEHLRNVRESGFAEKAVEVRQLIRELRDRESYAFREDRQGFHLKSLLEILQSQSVTPMEGIAALSKSATKLMLGVVKHV